MRAWGYTALALLVATAALAAETASGRWEAKAPMPSKRTEVAAAAIGTKIYVVGGFTMLGATGRLDVYDTAADRWETKRSLPESRHHVGIGAVGGKLYVIGGFGGTLFWDPVDTVYEYDPAVDTWRKKASMPTKRGGLAVAERNGLLYAVGGLGEEKRNSGALEVYDPAADRWSALPPMPTPRDHLGAAIVGDLLVTAGGRLKSSYADNLATVELFNLQTRQWRAGASMSTPRSGVAAVALGRHVLLFGGEAPSGTFHENEVYGPVADRWVTLAPMPTARHGLGAAVVEGSVYVISGGPKPGGSFSDVNEAFMWTAP